MNIISDRPVSFEVFEDDLTSMLLQAKVISSWGANVYVKIPVTNTKGEFTGPIIKELSNSGVQLNITAVFTPKQVETIADNLSYVTYSVYHTEITKLVSTLLFYPSPVLGRKKFRYG